MSKRYLKAGSFAHTLKNKSVYRIWHILKAIVKIFVSAGCLYYTLLQTYVDYARPFI